MEELPFKLPDPRPLDPLPPIGDHNPSYGHHEDFGTGNRDIVESVNIDPHARATTTTRKQFEIYENDDSTGGSGNDVVVAAGAIQCGGLFADSNGNGFLGVEEIVVSELRFNTQDTDSLGGTIGSQGEVIGIWVELQYASLPSTPKATYPTPIAWGSPTLPILVTSHQVSSANLIWSRQYNVASDASAIVAQGSAEGYVWIGQIDMSDSSGNDYLITQYNFGPINVQMPTFLYGES